MTPTVDPHTGLDHSPGATARGYSWPDATPGNLIALKHGAGSPRKVQPLAEQVEQAIIQAAPWTASAAFTGARQSYAWAEGQAQLLRAYIDVHGMLDEEGEERSAVRSLDRVEGRLAKLRDQLGLNPTALSKLLATSAEVARATGDEATVEALAAEGRRILDAQVTAAAELGAGTTKETDDDA